MKYKFTQEEQEELDKAIELMEDPFAFENYCSACDNFQTDKCPFRNKVTFKTKWKQIHCNNFWD